MVLGFIADIINFIIDLIVNLFLLVVEIVVFPFRLLAYLITRLIDRRRTIPRTGYLSRPWGWNWNRRRYF